MTDIRNTTMGPDETIRGVYAEYWFILMRPIAILILGLALFILLFSIAWSMREVHLIWAQFLALGAFGILMTVHHVFFVNLFRYSFSSLILTDLRLIEYRVVPFVKDEVTFVSIELVNEVIKNKQGVLQNLLDYGRITIEAGTAEVRFNYMARPAIVAEAIEKVRDERKAASQK